MYSLDASATIQLYTCLSYSATLALQLCQLQLVAFAQLVAAMPVAASCSYAFAQLVAAVPVAQIVAAMLRVCTTGRGITHRYESRAALQRTL